jgi:trans-aconitate methyltransferase
MSGQLDEIKRRIRQQLEVGQGEFVLDVGCGTGDDARRLSALVGPSGRIISVDDRVSVANSPGCSGAPAAQAGVITAADKSHWLAELTETAKTGCFVAAATCFLVRGIKPFGT